MINRFFDLSSVSDPTVKEFAEQIKAQNDQFNFLGYFVKNNGYLQWAKFEKLKNAAETSIIIPFVLNGQNEFNGFVIGRKIQGKFNFFLFRKKIYPSEKQSNN